MLSRRTLLAAGSGLGLAPFVFAAGQARAAAVMTDAGFYREDWFTDSFLELADDRAGAAAAGKHLAVLWEQRGCPYCRDTHLVNFADGAIAAYVADRFDVVQLDLHGARLVTDFDGERLGERQLAAKYAVRGTPTVQFFPRADDPGRKAPRQREVVRIQGYLPPKPFLLMFSFIGEDAYERESLSDYRRRHG